MMLRPIPLSLLNDSVTLRVPYASGYESCEINNVRVVHRSEISDRAAVNVRDVSEITVYYDHEHSTPSDMEFAAGMLLVHGGLRYEIVRAEAFSAEGPHHIRITARKV